MFFKWNRSEIKFIFIVFVIVYSQYISIRGIEIYFSQYWKYKNNYLAFQEDDLREGHVLYAPEDNDPIYWVHEVFSEQNKLF